MVTSQGVQIPVTLADGYAYYSVGYLPFGIKDGYFTVLGEMRRELAYVIKSVFRRQLTRFDFRETGFLSFRVRTTAPAALDDTTTHPASNFGWI